MRFNNLWSCLDIYSIKIVYISAFQTLYCDQNVRQYGAQGHKIYGLQF